MVLEKLHPIFEEDPNWELTSDQLLSPPAIGLGIIWLSLMGFLAFYVSSNVTPTRKPTKKNITTTKTVEIDLWQTIKGLLREGPIGQWNHFWRKFPRRMWNFYIECLIIPNYRLEWGKKYQSWSYRSPDRIEPSDQAKEILRFHKHQSKLRAALAAGEPQPLPHNHAECARVKFNINGTMFETQLRTLNRYPDTLLGNELKLAQYYDPQSGCHFFDRTPASFEAILYFFQSGGYLRRPENVHIDVFYDDTEFYQLPEIVINNFKIDEGLGRKEAEMEKMPKNLLQRKIWLLFDYPESSIQARVLAIISVFVIVLSISLFCIETVPEFMGHREMQTRNHTLHIIFFDSLDLNDPFFFTETVCSIWFTLEFLARFLSAPVKWDFIFNLNNFIDFVSVVPYYLTIITDQHEKDREGGATSSLSAFRVIRLVRVFRIFKLSRHSRGLQILGQTLSNSLSELFLLIFFVFLGVILFSSCLYFAEQGESTTHFTSIPQGFWFCIITMTTVGYGEIVPRTVGGRIVGSLCAITGVLTIALPVPVIVSNFNYFYHQSIDQQEFSFTQMNHVANCPYRPSGGSGPKSPPNTVEIVEDHSNNISIRRTVESDMETDSEPEIYSSDEEFSRLKYSRKSN